MRDQVSQPTEKQGTLYGTLCLNLQILRQQTRRKMIPNLTELGIPDFKSILHDYNFNLLRS